MSKVVWAGPIGDILSSTTVPLLAPCSAGVVVVDVTVLLTEAWPAGAIGMDETG